MALFLSITFSENYHLPPEINMPEPIHTGPDGRKYRHVATVTTTPKTDTSAKQIDVNAETVCPNMTNEEFAKTITHVRDVAIKLADVRIANLSRWNIADRAEVIEWFGSDSDDIRSILQTGLPQMKRVLSSLTPSNFVRWSITALNHLNCSGNGDRNTAAAVCSPDVDTHTIAIGINFCEMPDEKKYLVRASCWMVTQNC